MAKRYALLSVFDKTGIIDLAKTLVKKNYAVISTGGTAKVLSASGIPFTSIEKITGNPESFDGRMKTISFQVEGGILFDRKSRKHQKEAKKLKVPQIDIVVCNLYPFEQTVSKKSSTQKQIVESIDVGGPTMIRSAAKNYRSVLALTDPRDYAQTVVLIEKNKITEPFRKAQAAKAFQHLSFYDAQIAEYLYPTKYPQEKTIPGRKTIELRYGENPHQKESFVYVQPGTNSPIRNLVKRTGRDLSYVNVTDIIAGLETVRMFKEPAAVVIKHNSPCGIALGKDPREVLIRAVEADPLSAFGGVTVLNSTIDEATAKMFAEFKKRGVQMDIIAAPSLSNSAEELIHSVRKTTGVYTFGKIPSKRADSTHLKFFDGGFVSQPWDDNVVKNFRDWKCVTKKKPTKKQLEQMKIAWKFISRIRSNTILVMDKSLPMTRGIGSGQTARIFSARIALEQAGNLAKGAVLASDSFFPFPDTVTLAAKKGIAAIVQQGGSVNDKLSIEAADKAGLVMIMTGKRAFWH